MYVSPILDPMAANRFELLATWYLRFNGYFTVPNFIVHKDYRNRPGGTDADVLAVRFPHSCEYQRRFEFEHDPELVSASGRVDFVICEVKTSRCDINEPWIRAERANVEYALRWMGFEENDTRLSQIAGDVYNSGFSEPAGMWCSVRFIAIGNEENIELKTRMPAVKQILHSRVIDFLRRRFTTNCEGVNRQSWESDIVVCP